MKLLAIRSYMFMLAFAIFTASARAQSTDSDEIRLLVQESVEATEQEGGCDLDVIGEPQFDGFLQRWYVNYTATGGECDAASANLQELAEPMGVQFVRRPNLSQLHAVLANEFASVRNAFGCQISLVGEPQIQESTGRWLVDYRATGRNCEGADEELRRRGKEIAVAFQGRPAPNLTLQTR